MVPYQDVTAFYAQLDCVTQAMPATALRAGLSLTANNICIDYGSVLNEPRLDYLLKLHPTPPVNKDKVINRFINDAVDRKTVSHERYDALKERYQKSKVTGLHHDWFKLYEILYTYTAERKVFARRIMGATQGWRTSRAFVSGLLLWAATADYQLVDYVTRSKAIWLGTDSVEEWYTKTKAVLADIKLYRSKTFNLSQLYELQTLVNRGIGKIDTESEIANRTTRLRVVDVDPVIVEEIATELLLKARAEGGRHDEKNWIDYWMRRWANVPTGAVHSQYMEDQKYIEKDLLLRTKQYTLSKMGFRRVDQLLNRNPEIVGWSSIKYEWGKERAIYGTDLTSYLLTDFAYGKIENTLAASFPVGPSGTEDIVKDRIGMACQGGVPFCFDYEDFNSQHSTAAMVAVLNAYENVFDDTMSDEQIEASKWVKQALLSQRIVSEGSEIPISGTLLSGWRLTTFMNTMLNKIYLLYAGCKNDMKDSLHNGDDALIYCRSVQDAVNILKKTDKAGIRAQTSKCAIGSIAEFLRVDHNASEPTGAQYLARAVATAVHARTESQEPESVISYLTSQKTRITEIAQRSGNIGVTQNLWQTAVKVAKKLFPKSAPYVETVIKTNVALGGLSEKLDYEPEGIILIKRKKDWAKKRKKLLPGVYDYTNYLIETLNLDYSFRVNINDALMSATEMMTERMRPDIYVDTRYSHTPLVKVQMIRQTAETNRRENAAIGMARLAGLPLSSLMFKRKPTPEAIRIILSDDKALAMRCMN